MVKAGILPERRCESTLTHRSELMIIEKSVDYYTVRTRQSVINQEIVNGQDRRLLSAFLYPMPTIPFQRKAGETEDDAIAGAKQELAAALRNIMDARKWTQSRMAQALGTTQSRVSEIVNGKLSSVSLEQLLRHFLRLHIPVSLSIAEAAPEPHQEAAVLVPAAPVLSSVDLRQDIKPFDEFQKHSVRYRRHVMETGRPLVLTVEGHAEMVLLSIDTYHHLTSKKTSAKKS